MKLRLTTVCCNFDVSLQCEIIPNYFFSSKNKWRRNSRKICAIFCGRRRRKKSLFVSSNDVANLATRPWPKDNDEDDVKEERSFGRMEGLWRNIPRVEMKCWGDKGSQVVMWLDRAEVKKQKSFRSSQTKVRIRNGKKRDEKSHREWNHRHRPAHMCEPR